jgi:hypothetical protein
MTTTDTCEVIEADREAAWPFRPSCFKAHDESAWKSGRYDKTPVIVAFARHRQAHTPDAVESSMVRLVAKLIAAAIVGQDDEGWYPDDDWDLKLAYLDQGETDFEIVATAAIAAMRSKT